MWLPHLAGLFESPSVEPCVGVVGLDNVVLAYAFF